LLVDELSVFGVLSFPDSDFALWAGRKFWCTWEIFLAGERAFFVFLPTLQRYDIAIAVHEYLSRFF